MGLGIIGARRLVDDFHMESSPGEGTTVILGKQLPPGSVLTTLALARLADQLAREPQDIYDEIRHQNQELLNTLDELRRREEDLNRMNCELEDTNRGVVALYAELDQRAEQLRHADQMKSRFLSHVSHEFRTPLNAIVGLTRLLLKRDLIAQSVEASREITFIQQTAQSVTEMVDDLLDLAKAESGKLTVEAADFSVSTLFSTLRAMMRPLAVNSAVELSLMRPRCRSCAATRTRYPKFSGICSRMRLSSRNAARYAWRPVTMRRTIRSCSGCPTRESGSLPNTRHVSSKSSRRFRTRYKSE